MMENIQASKDDGGACVDVSLQKICRKIYIC